MFIRWNKKVLLATNLDVRFDILSGRKEKLVLPCFVRPTCNYVLKSDVLWLRTDEVDIRVCFQFDTLLVCDDYATNR